MISSKIAQFLLRAALQLIYIYNLLNLKFISAACFIFIFSGIASMAQVKIRLYANQTPELSVFSVNEGAYGLNTYSGDISIVRPGDLVSILKFGDRLVIKLMNYKAVVCDSVYFEGKTGRDLFSLLLPGRNAIRKNYSGDLKCLSDMGTLLFINTCNIELYIAGVVRAEGGPGKYPEYFKTQAVIARTYMARYLNKHSADHFNLCDNTHCQAFNGVTSDPEIIKASLETGGEIILDADSMPIIAAFHSNCGGETSPSEDVWLTPQSYLKKVTDPYCHEARNAKWYRSIALAEWTGYLRKSGFTGLYDDYGSLNFSQINRTGNYRTGTFMLPLRQIRSDFELRSTFFSLTVNGDSVILKGKGYGHGVGLCQEGAMVMAGKGLNYRQIINFYYSGVRIGNIGFSDPVPDQALKTY